MEYTHMEHNQTSALFTLSIDPVTKAHLSETAKWARFLAIVGFVFLGIMLIAGIAMALTISSLKSFPDSGMTGGGYFNAFGLGMSLFYLVLALIWFFPLLYLLRFSGRMKAALNSDDQQALNTSFQNLKVCFRFVGIITIIILAFYALAIVLGIAGAALS